MISQLSVKGFQYIPVCSPLYHHLSWSIALLLLCNKSHMNQNKNAKYTAKRFSTKFSADV